MQLVVQIISSYVIHGDKVEHWVLGTLVLEEAIYSISLQVMSGEVLGVVAMQQLRNKNVR